MPRIGIGTLILLTVLVLGQSGMAKPAAPISQMYGEGGLVRADDEKMSLLTAGELFTIRVLPESGCFDGPAQNCIQIEWISIAEVLDEGNNDSSCLAEADAGGLEELHCDFSESSISGSFLLEVYVLGIGCFETLPPQRATEGGLLLVLGE
jgi:hypothetical protein